MGKIMNMNLKILEHIKKILNVEQKKTDFRKDRKRNLVPAKVGIYGFFMFLIYVINYAVTAQLVTIRSLHKTSLSFQKHFRNKLLVCQLKAG